MADHLDGYVRTVYYIYAGRTVCLCRCGDANADVEGTVVSVLIAESVR